MILKFLFLMTFFCSPGFFFHHFLLKFNYWGDGGQCRSKGGGGQSAPGGKIDVIPKNKNREDLKKGREKNF